MTLPELYALAATMLAHPGTATLEVVETHDPVDGKSYWGVQLAAQPRDKRATPCRGLLLSKGCASRESALWEASEELPGFVSWYKLGTKET